MALTQPNSSAIWTEDKGSVAVNEIVNCGLVDQGTHYTIEETEVPDARLLDQGNDAYETVESPDNPDDDPELGLINVGDAVIMTYE